MTYDNGHETALAISGIKKMKPSDPGHSCKAPYGRDDGNALGTGINSSGVQRKFKTGPETVKHRS